MLGTGWGSGRAGGGQERKCVYVCVCLINIPHEEARDTAQQSIAYRRDLEELLSQQHSAELRNPCVEAVREGKSPFRTSGTIQEEMS